MEQIDPRSYIRRLVVADRKVLADALRISAGHLNNIAYGQREVTPLLAARFDRVTNGLVPRRLSRPDDWREIWPELVEASQPESSLSA
jgi:DNA-binding transcriptional regulator YdaS (Cro superfamily)